MRISRTVLLNTSGNCHVDWTRVEAYALGGVFGLSVWGVALHWVGVF
jgi:hypothetical protein